MKHRMQPDIYFYLPLDEKIELPKNTNDYWSWQTTIPTAGGSFGQYHWILQTYLYLRENGFRCHFMRHIPSNGILVTHHSHVPEDFHPPGDLLVISTLVDRGISSRKYCDLYIVHSPLQEKPDSNRFFYIPPWPQIGLKPRNSERSSRFKNAAFFGNLSQLTQELKSDSFEQELKRFGLKWNIVDRNQWNDFSSADLIIAIRSFSKARTYPRKSALRLINAWTAGVPVILGREVSFQTVGRKNEDYIEAGSVDEIFKSVEKLKSDIGFRKTLVENGKARAREFTPEKTLQRWIHFLFDIAIPEYENHRKLQFKRRYFYLSADFKKPIRRFKKKFRKVYIYKVLKSIRNQIRRAVLKK